MLYIYIYMDRVQNVKQVHLGDGPIFSSHSDHSKWAIANDGKEPWVCVADINRMVSYDYVNYTIRLHIHV